MKKKKAIALVEDESDVQAAKELKAEVHADIAEFDENNIEMDTQNDDPDMLDDPNRINNRQINDMNRLESEFKLIETEVYKQTKKL